MLRNRFLALAVATAAVTATAQSTSTSAATGASAKSQCLYVHPLSTIVSTGIETIPLILPLTYERELENAKSLTLQPTLELGSYKVDDQKIEVTGLQLIATYRNYLNGKENHGLYLAPGVRLGYVSYSEDVQTYSYDANWNLVSSSETKKATVTEGAVLGYLGYRAKFDAVSVYCDLGLGYSFASISGDDIDDVSGTGLAADANLGIGYNF